MIPYIYIFRLIFPADWMAHWIVSIHGLHPSISIHVLKLMNFKSISFNPEIWSGNCIRQIKSSFSPERNTSMSCWQYIQDSILIFGNSTQIRFILVANIKFYGQCLQHTWLPSHLGIHPNLSASPSHLATFTYENPSKFISVSKPLATFTFVNPIQIFFYKFWCIVYKWHYA